MSRGPIDRSAVRPKRRAALLAAALVVTSLTFAVGGEPAVAAGGEEGACLGEPGTDYTLTTSGNGASGTVTFTAPGSSDVTADYTLTTSDLVGHPSVLISIQNRVDRFGRGIEYLPQSRPGPLGNSNYWTTPFGDAVTATFDVEVDDAAARVRLAQVLGDRGGNSEASTYTVSWEGVGGVAVVSDPVEVDAVYHSGAPATSSGDPFAKANGEIEGLKTGDTLTSGSSFVVYQTANKFSNWSIEFPAGARDIRVVKVALSGATHAQGALQAGDRDDPAQGRDVQLPRYGVFTDGTQGGASDGAPGQTYQEFLAFQVLFVAEECIVPIEDPVEEPGDIEDPVDTVDDEEDPEDAEDPEDTGIGGSDAGGSEPAPSTPVLSGASLPTLTSGQGVWQLADGTSVPLTVSSPGVNQVRYTADGMQVTFTGGEGSDATRGLLADAGGEIVCEVCVKLGAGEVIEAWMFSTPRLVAAHRSDAEPCQRFAIPLAAPLDGGGAVSAGAHTLQLARTTASGMQAVNVGVTVGGPVPASVPAGEGPAAPSGLVALGLLAAAGALLAARRPVVTG